MHYALCVNSMRFAGTQVTRHPFYLFLPEQVIIPSIGHAADEGKRSAEEGERSS